VSDPAIIRPVAPADFAQWERLWDGYNRFYERAIPRDVTLMTWSRFFDAYDPVHALIAESEGDLVGIVHYLFHRNTAMIAPTCYLQDLFTSQEAAASGAR
jgi:hypothetical protein